MKYQGLFLVELIGAQMKYSKFPCAEHSDEPLKAEIVFASGLHNFLSSSPLHKKKLSIFHLCVSVVDFSKNSIEQFKTKMI